MLGAQTIMLVHLASPFQAYEHGAKNILAMFERVQAKAMTKVDELGWVLVQCIITINVIKNKRRTYGPMNMLIEKLVIISTKSTATQKK